MRKHIFLALIFIIIFIAPIGLNAAYDDVTLTTDAVITVSSIDLNVSGSSATIESIVVNSGNFVVTLQPSSTLTVTSSDNKDFSTNAGSTHVTETCGGSESTLALTSTSLSNVVVLVTVSSDTCVDSTVSSTPASSSGGGGGGGGSSVASAPGVITTTSRLQIIHPDGTIEYLDEGTTAMTPEVSETTITTAPAVAPSAGILSSFARNLERGSSHSDTKRLQQLLNSDPDTAVAASGVGSAGNETNYFGSLTQRAVEKFQAKYGIVSSGTPETTGYGLVGPKTRAKLAEVFGGGLTVPASSVATPSAVAASVSPVFNTGLSRGDSNSDIKRLQQLLNSDPDTAVAASGVGSAGNETNYFGSLTQRAVEKFQAKYGIVSSGTPETTGYGLVGPKTRAKLAEVFGE